MADLTPKTVTEWTKFVPKNRTQYRLELLAADWWRLRAALAAEKARAEKAEAAVARVKAMADDWHNPQTPGYFNRFAAELVRAALRADR